MMLLLVKLQKELSMRIYVVSAWKLPLKDTSELSY